MTTLKSLTLYDGLLIHHLDVDEDDGDVLLFRSTETADEPGRMAVMRIEREMAPGVGEVLMALPEPVDPRQGVLL